MCVEIKIDSLDNMCDDNCLDSKQGDIEVKIKHLNIDMININYKLDLNRLNFYEPSYRYKKNFARNLQQYVRKAHSFRCGMDSTKYRDNVYVDIENIHIL